MRFDQPLVPGRLVRRYKRFLADVRLDDGEIVTAHCANPGTMISLLRDDARVLLSRSDNPNRRTPFTWELVRVGRTWAGVNTMRTNHVVEAALRRHAIPELDGYEEIRPETPMGENRRVDFLLRTGDDLCFVEVKNVTLAVGDVALFPDAVTMRGRAHLVELAERVAEGHRAAMLYLVNRSDCVSAGPAAHIDPGYAETLAKAVEGGVETLAYRARAGKHRIRVERRIPFRVIP
jgi:sugar fermentation stimulation protein A